MADPHLEILLPDWVGRPMSGGPRWPTTKFKAASGYEKRNREWQQALREFDIRYSLAHDVDDNDPLYGYYRLLEFFNIVAGEYYSFRIKDWSDYLIGDTTVSPATVASTQVIGEGDDSTTAFQIYKRYSFGGFNHDRTIVKILEDSDQVMIESTPLTRVASAPGAGEYSIDIDTGIVTTGDTPASTGGSGTGGAQQVRVSCEFHTPGRFATDLFQLNLELIRVGQLPAVTLEEVRLRL